MPDNMLNEINEFDFDARRCNPDYRKSYVSPVENRKINLGGLQILCMSCRMCSLGQKYIEEKDQKINPHVFSNMVDSKFMVIGQNPGYNEAVQGEPFIGPSGKNFDTELAKHNLNRKQFYISNVVKCYTPDNKKPCNEYRELCAHILKLELCVIRPKLIITLGEHPFSYLCPERVYSEALGKITKTDFVIGGLQLPVFAVYHPSPTNLSVPERKRDFEKQIAMLAKLVKKLL